MGKPSTTEYYHADWSNKIYAKLYDTKSIEEELDDYGLNTYIDLYDTIESFYPRFAQKYRHSQHDRWADSADTFIGVSECDERDEFDLEKGKKIASLKADLKYHDRLDRDYDFLIEGIDEVKRILLERKQKHVRCYNKLYDKLVSDYGWTNYEERSDAE